MNTRLLAAIPLACLLAGGCCRNPRMDVYIDAMNAEKRSLEDRIYELEYEKKKCDQELAALRQGGEKTAQPTPASPPQNAEPTKPDQFDQDHLTPPKIEPGVPETPDLGIPMTPLEKTPARGAAGKAKKKNSDQEAPPPKVAERLDNRVSQIYLDPHWTGGVSLSSRPGDEGLSVLIEPRNEAGQYVPQAGRLSIVVLDPAQRGQGEAARVAQWTVDSLEANQLLQKPPRGRGILWQAPWPNGSPKSDTLELFVRMETIDGRRLESHQTISVTPPQQVSQRWTPRRSADQLDAASPAPRLARETGEPGSTARPAPDDRAPGQLSRPAWRPYR